MYSYCCFSLTYMQLNIGWINRYMEMRAMSWFVIINDTSWPIREKNSQSAPVFNCWEINDATVKPNKLNSTLTQIQSQCVRQPCPPALSMSTMKRQVVIHSSQVLDIIMRDCEPLWHGYRCFPLPSVFLRTAWWWVIFFAAWHSVTYSAPQMVLTVIHLVALSVAW